MRPERPGRDSREVLEMILDAAMVRNRFAQLPMRPWKAHAGRADLPLQLARPRALHDQLHRAATQRPLHDPIRLRLRRRRRGQRRHRDTVGQRQARGRRPHHKTVPVVFSTDDTFDVGADWGTPVSPTYQPPFEFTGTLKQVTQAATRSASSTPRSPPTSTPSGNWGAST
jgi:hypothetical protein